MTRERARIVIRGAVQGVGFRPFIHRLAGDAGLAGTVLNCAQGVVVEVEGARELLDDFISRVRVEKPPVSVILSMEISWIEPLGLRGFEISRSESGGVKTALILPDIATCPECLREILDPGDRRHLYPFTNCTRCGPRFSIIRALPYDRANTSMRAFAMCPACEAEYRDPADRRFHAQPVACHDCGPQLAILDAAGRETDRRHAALLAAADAIRAGEIVAVKGLGGFQLFVDARNEQAVNELRRRKHREAKPLAVMVADGGAARSISSISLAEQTLLESPAAPIVLLRRAGKDLAPSLAPGNPYLGIMLPCTPLHHLLLRELGFPVVATSGNRCDEPICIENGEAVNRLHGIADRFLVHDRPILRHVDDSVARVMLGREQILRRARGYALLPVPAGRALPCILATGAHLKNTVAMSGEAGVFLSQHIGDLETPAAHEAFRRVCRDLPGLYQAEPVAVACDLHPEYLSTKAAAALGPRCIPVQHHFAHVLSCMAENELTGPVLGIAWDGTGLGSDGTIWGGEFLIPNGGNFTRAAHFRTFPLPGGDAAIREPRRCALGMFHEAFGDSIFKDPDQLPMRHFTPAELAVLRQALRRRLNSPRTSSVGRIFDAVASLAGLRQRAGFEGQAAMELEFAVASDAAGAYTIEFRPGTPAILDWEPMLLEILRDLGAGVATGVIAARFHQALVAAAVAVARAAGIGRVVLSGGCFQNRVLAEKMVRALRENGFRPFWHQRVPTNDGGISLGQAMAAAATLEETPNSFSNDESTPNLKLKHPTPCA